MPDSISGIKYINPTYPVKPVQPARKDRETDRRKKPNYDAPDQGEDDRNDDLDGDRRPTIDEHV